MQYSFIPGPQPGGGAGGGSAPAAPKTIIIRGVTGTPGTGSTNNRIPRFNAEVYNNSGSDFTFTDSATLGSHFTIVTAGLYFVQLALVQANATAYGGIRKGVINNTINVNETDINVYPLGFGSSGYLNVSGYVQCAAADVLHGILSAAPFAGYPGIWKFGLAGPF